MRGRLVEWAPERVSWRPAPWLWALSGFAIAFWAVTWPLLSRFGHATYGGPGDGWALIWQTRFRLDHGISYFSSTYSTDIAWPVGSHYVNSILLSNAAIELPNLLLLGVGIGDVPAYNLVVLGVALGSSLAMYACLRRLDCRPSVAFWGGLAYLIAPWHLEKLSIHPTLASLAFLPLLVLGIVEWARSPNLRSGALVVAAAALGTYTHSYYGLATGLFLATSLPLVLVAARRRGTLRSTLRRSALLLVPLLLVPLPLGIALQLQDAQLAAQLDRPVYDVAFTAHPYLWLLPSPDNPVLGELSRDYVSSRGLRANEGELALYVGVITLILAAAGLVFAARGRVTRLGAALGAWMALLGVALSVPATVRVPLLGAVKMPVAYLNDVVAFISTPARFFALTLTGAILLAGLGLEGLIRRLDRRLAIPLVAVACLLSALELPFRRDGFVVDTRPTPIVHLIEQTVPSGDPVAQYPSMTRDFKPIADQLFYQLAHGHPLLNGATPATPEDAVRSSVEGKDDPALASKLALLGFHWATYDARQAQEAGLAPADARGYVPPRGLKVVRRLPDGSAVMRVQARPAAALAGIATGIDRVDRWMTSPDATILACASSTGEYVLRFQSGAFAEPRRFTLGNSRPLVVDASGQLNDVRAKVALRAGWNLLRFHLIGSKPVRPSDVIPGHSDTRPLVMTVGAITVSGPRGPPANCQHGPVPQS
jgi:hypothetical protein